MSELPKPRARIRDASALCAAKIRHRECCICGRTHAIHIHHIVFRSHGGDDVDANLCGLCPTHHDQIHAYDSFSWIALKAYVDFERPDTQAYLQEKLGDRAGSFFERG